MDNKFAKSRMSIGESSNLAQLAMTYYWTNPDNQELYDNFVILSVLAQVAIDSCKREYEVDPITEIERIKKMDCMNLTRNVVVNGKIKKVKCDLPYFMKYTKEIKYTKNGVEIPYEEVKESKDKIKRRINKSLICPMNWLQDILNNIQMASNENTTPTEKFFIKMTGLGNNRQMAKIRNLVEEYDIFIKKIVLLDLDDESIHNDFIEATNDIILKMNGIKIGNIVTINRLIETALCLDKYNNNENTRKYNDAKYTRKMLNMLYKMNKNKFLTNFIEK